MNGAEGVEEGDPLFPAGASKERPTHKRRGNGEAPSKFDDLARREANYPHTWVSDAAIELDRRYLVKGLIDQGSFILIYGPSGSGKSFFTADIAQAIATGREWRGRKVNKSLVVYVASEAGSSILKRFVGWRENRVTEALGAIPLAVLTRGPNLIANTQVERLREDLAQLQDEAKLPLGLVIFDTLSRSMPGGDENNAEDMTEVISAADYFRDTFKSATAFVHHSGKDIDKGARGHSSLFAASDCVLRVSDGLASVEKVRDGVAGEQFPFVLERIVLGKDSDGDDVSTCLLNEVSEHSPADRSKVGLGKNQRPILDALRQLVSDKGIASPGTSAIPKAVLVVSFEELCKRIEPKHPGKKPWQVKKAVGEAITGLENSGHVGVHGDSVWLR